MQRDIFFQFAEQNVNAINRYTKVLYFIVCRLKKGRRDENAIESRYKRDKIKHVSFWLYQDKVLYSIIIYRD